MNILTSGEDGKGLVITMLKMNIGRESCRFAAGQAGKLGTGKLSNKNAQNNKKLKDGYPEKR